MSLAIGELHGTININHNKRRAKKEESDCYSCVHGWIPTGDVTRIVKKNGDVVIMNGAGVICMDESNDKTINFYGGEMVCSKFERKPTLENNELQ